MAKKFKGKLLNHPNQRVRFVARALHARGLLTGALLIAKELHVPFEEAASKKRQKSITAARHAIWRWLRAKGHSYPQIAYFWWVDHTTVHAAVKKRPPAPNPAYRCAQSSARCVEAPLSAGCRSIVRAPEQLVLARVG